MEPAGVRPHREFRAGCSFRAIHHPLGGLMPIPVIAITNASSCVSDMQVESVMPALQKQVSCDFKSYWGLDCTLTGLPEGQPLTQGWWQIVIADTPDQAGALGYHEMSSRGTPLGKVFAKFDIANGYSW